MRAFIVRPFGKKIAKSGREIDFDLIEEKLIDPALSAAEIEGRTTGEIISQGNIRRDMFQRLLTADVVVADITVDNANAYYELGIRHAMRDRVTILLRGTAAEGTPEPDPVPFDLKTDRYLAYDLDDPAGSVKDLTSVIKASQRNKEPDSPVFQMLPGMQPQEKLKFQSVPIDFSDAHAVYLHDQRRSELSLLSEEIARFKPDWELLGQFMIAKALFNLGAYGRAAKAWEHVLFLEPENIRANLQLGTCYQKLGDPARSNLALERVESDRQTTHDNAERLSLMASNRKSLWIDDWKDEPDDRRADAALASGHLDEARSLYAAAFKEDLNHYYSGFNALALTIIELELADANVDTWRAVFLSEKEADDQYASLMCERNELAVAVQVSLDAAATPDDQDQWLSLTRVELALLTIDRPNAVARQYQRALGAVSPQQRDSVLRQLEIYTGLGVRGEVAKQAADTVRNMGTERTKSVSNPIPLIFTGHRVDLPDRATPRFPNTPQAIQAATQMIRSAIEKHTDQVDNVMGIAGGASGGDLIFHEQCAEIGVASTLLLALPREEYMKSSVNDGGPDWIDRFNTVYAALSEQKRVLVLQEEPVLPDWLSEVGNYSVWERNNFWTIGFGLLAPPGQARLIALWNQEPGDNSGGTQDMVDLARQYGMGIDRLPAEELAAAGG